LEPDPWWAEYWRFLLVPQNAGAIGALLALVTLTALFLRTIIGAIKSVFGFIFRQPKDKTENDKKARRLTPAQIEKVSTVL